jgi:thiamine biosynthesis protein ThiS
MTIFVNGTPVSVQRNTTIYKIVCQLSTVPPPTGIAVAQNLDVVPRSQWKNTAVGENDEIEILWASSGG